VEKAGNTERDEENGLSGRVIIMNAYAKVAGKVAGLSEMWQ